MTYALCCVIGTRPEALKMAPVIAALTKYPSFKVNTLVTGQHRELIDQTLACFELTISNDLFVMTPNQELHTLTAALIERISQYFKNIKPDVVIVQGDTTTTFVSALAAYYLHIPVAYVESGLRSGNINRPFPEEMNRQCISRLATLNFSPTATSRNNLLLEGINPDSIVVTGNTIIDTLLYFANKQQESPHPPNIKTILVTCHRRENFGQNILNICAAIKIIVKTHANVNVILPVHPNPKIRNIVYEQLDGTKRVSLTQPLDYPDLVQIMSQCYLILTDSGGLQEEGPALNKPVLVIRTETERPEAVATGASKVVGVETDNIVRAVDTLLTNEHAYQAMVQAKSPFGDGTASITIARAISNYLNHQPLTSNQRKSTGSTLITD